METQTQLAPAITETPASLINMVDGVPMVSSLEIAERFGKQHKDVLRAIKNLDCSEEFNQRNFAPVTETVIRQTGGLSIPAYNLTRDGFSFLVMGFTGKKAAQWKEKFILAFNAMEEKVRNGQFVPDFSDPRNLLACFEHLSGQVKQLEGTIGEQQVRLKKLDRIEHSQGSMCITDAAKVLKVKPKQLFQFLQTREWIYRRVGKAWIGYQTKVQTGYLEHTEHTYTKDDGTSHVNVQVRITPKGMVRLAELLDQPLN